MKHSLSRIFILLLVLSAFFTYNTAVAQEAKPSDVVMEWTKVYGVDMNKASDLTTPALRKNKPKPIWATEIGKTLQKIKYKHLGGKIVEQKVEKDKALVLLLADISTASGTVKEKEFYFMRKVEGKWLIDRIAVTKTTFDHKKIFNSKPA